MTSANTDALKSMLTNLINDKPEEATLDFHTYLVPKVREVAGLASADPNPVDPALEADPTDPAAVDDPAAPPADGTAAE